MTMGSLLMLGTSIGGTRYVFKAMESYNPEKFPSEQIVLQGYQIPHKKFNANLVEKDSVWYYISHKGDSINLYNTTDYKFLGDLSHKSFKNVPATFKIDTVEVKINKKNKEPMFSYGNLDSLQYVPALGRQDYGKMTIRYFWSENAHLNALYQKYNDEYNCTVRHEYQHFLNAKSGILKSGQSYETKFGHACMDEVSANLAQLLEQRQNYQKTKDINRITDRFDFYRQWILSHKGEISNKLSEEEKNFIANGVFDAWKNDKFKIYEENNFKIARCRLRNADYNGCIDHPEDHKQIMHDIFYINGMEFYKYIDGREQEFVDMLSPEYKKQYAQLTAAKKNQMKYMEKVGAYTKNDSEAKYDYFKGLKEKHLWNTSYLRKLLR